jgi:hypothetical protein
MIPQYLLPLPIEIRRPFDEHCPRAHPQNRRFRQARRNGTVMPHREVQNVAVKRSNGWIVSAHGSSVLAS